MKKHSAGNLLILMLLAACSPTMDMHGIDPGQYYSEHPISNNVEMHHVSQRLYFESGKSRLDEGQVQKLKRALRGVSPMAADGVQVQLPAADKDNPSIDQYNDVRRKHLTAVLRSMGYDKGKISFEPSPSLSKDDVQVDVQYAAIVPPNCPDWRTSPVTTYSNTSQGNFKCATTVNLGVMVADPHDLIRGRATVTPDTERSIRVVEQYRAGQVVGQTATTGGSSGSGGGDSGEESDSGGMEPPGGQ